MRGCCYRDFLVVIDATDTTATTTLKESHDGLELPDYVPWYVDIFSSVEILHSQGDAYQAVVAVKVLPLVLDLKIWSERRILNEYLECHKALCETLHKGVHG